MTHLQKKNNPITLFRFQTISIGGFILAIILLTYRNALHNFFIGDDFPWVYHVVKMRYHFMEGLLERYAWMGSTISFYLNLLISGTNPWGYNVTNLLIHLANVILVGFLGYMLTKDKLTGLLAMFLWGINAQGTEAILWKTGRGHSLVLFFILGTLLLFIAWDQKKKQWLYAFALLLAVCAHLTLFNAVILPGLLGFYLLVFKGIPGKIRHWRQYILPLFPFLLITGIYLFVYFFIFTPLSPSAYYGLKESLILKFGKYVSDYLIIFPEYFFQISYNEKLLPYLGGITALAFLAALLCMRNKSIRFSLIFMVVTMLPYLPVPMSVNYQPSRYRYIPLVGFSIILATLLIRLKNTVFLSRLIQRGIMLFEGLFLVIFVLGNMYFITLDKMDYGRYGKIHQTLVNKTQAMFNRLPLDQTILFINLSNLNVPASDFEKILKPKLWFPRREAPWKLVFMKDMLTFCGYTAQKHGFFIILDKQEATQNILEGKYVLLAFSDEGFYFPKFPLRQVEQVIHGLGDSNSPSRIMALRYISTEK